MRLVLEEWNLDEAERLLCTKALVCSGSIVEAARILGITRHALKRRIIKHRIEWPPRAVRVTTEVPVAAIVVRQAAKPVAPVPAVPAVPAVPGVAEWLISQLESFLPERMRNEDLGDAREHIAAMVARGASPMKIWCQVLLVLWWTIKKIVKGPGGR